MQYTAAVKKVTSYGSNGKFVNYKARVSIFLKVAP